MRPFTKLEEALEAAQGQLDFYDGLHEGHDKKVREALMETIADIKEKIRNSELGVQPDA